MRAARKDAKQYRGNHISSDLGGLKKVPGIPRDSTASQTPTILMTTACVAYAAFGDSLSADFFIASGSRKASKIRFTSCCLG
jgi:hypothetical protein